MKYSAIHEFKELLKVINSTRLRSFATSLKQAAPNGFTIGKPLEECSDGSNGNIVDTIKSIEEAEDIPFTILEILVKTEISNRFIKNTQWDS